jgi:transposase
MLSSRQRVAILELARQGKGVRQIARALEVSRGAVRNVVRSQSERPPEVVRPEKATPYRAEILRLHGVCGGNLVRVHEELVASGAELSYPALTAFCRRQGIGQKAKKASGSYDFGPGAEMQHDTSPHKVAMGGRRRGVETASLALCYSRMLFFQHYPSFTRFECKVFLSEAFAYLGGACAVGMVDNTSVVVAHGTGAEMVPAPEMAAFADRYGFVFQAHEVGDANRSGRVERPFHFIENNFLAGRSFADWHDLNSQARAWCDAVNGRFRRHLRAIPRELFALERPTLRPLPIWVPEVYRLHHRLVDVGGYVNLHTNRYSTPDAWIGRRVEVRETWRSVEISLNEREQARHERVVEPEGRRVTLPEHRRPRGQGRRRPEPWPEEQAILKAAPQLEGYVGRLKTRGRKQPRLALRQLLRLLNEYPRAPLLGAVTEADHYGLFDLDRLERMVLQRVANDYFRLDAVEEDNP